MSDAFLTDGLRSIWEPAWRSCVERLHGQKSLIISAEVPGIQPGSGSQSFFRNAFALNLLPLYSKIEKCRFKDTRSTKQTGFASKQSYFLISCSTK